MDGRTTLFRETQRFTQRWVWALILGVAALTWYGLIRQILMGEPVGDRPIGDVAMVLIWLVVGVGFPLGLFLMRLDTRVTPKGIHVRFVPFHRWERSWDFDELTQIEPRRYAPLRDYGGWGIRVGPRGFAYNVKGHEGIQLVLGSGRRVLIGTQDPDRFMEAVRRAQDDPD